MKRPKLTEYKFPSQMIDYVSDWNQYGNELQNRIKELEALIQTPKKDYNNDINDIKKGDICEL